MLCKDIIEVLETAYPKEAALTFDNVGLLVGSTGKEVNTVYLALDVSTQVIEQAAEVGADMLITHHPLIFSPVKQVLQEDFVGRRIQSLIRSDIACYALHTNYDVFSMGRLSGDILGLQNSQVLDITYEREGIPQGIGRIGFLGGEMTLEECSYYVKNKLKLNDVKVFGDLKKKICCLAVSPGSGKSAIVPSIHKGADVLIAGDIGYHDGVDAVEQGLAVIDAGHYGTEYIFMEDMKGFFQENLPSIKIVTAPVVHPFLTL